MARIRSPGYPSFSLEEAIEMARKIHAADRQHPVDRGTAVRHLGFSGLSGASDRALSALMHYGLAEKVQKGELRITDLALEIMHPHSPEERRVALNLAGFSPGLFTELRERYPEAPPSKESLASYLSREGFASTAIGPATKAYLETCYFLQRERAYESDSGAPASAPESAPSPSREEPPMSTEYVDSPSYAPRAPAPAPAVVYTAAPQEERELNDIQTQVKGGTVLIEALLDVKGLRKLEKKIAALKLLLADDEEDEDDDRPLNS